MPPSSPHILSSSLALALHPRPRCQHVAVQGAQEAAHLCCHRWHLPSRRPPPPGWYGRGPYNADTLSFSSLRKHVIGGSDYLRDIENRTLGFERVFALGLPSRTDRRDNLVLQGALSDIQVEFVDGVKVEDVNPKAVPKDQTGETSKDGSLGAWRGHLNAIQKIVHENISSALIMEDDSDWDVRIRQQLRDFALSTHALIQPLRASPGSYADPSYKTLSRDVPVAPDILFGQLPKTIAPHSSPYGDDWDVLWLGYCGVQFPATDNPLIPNGRVIHLNDVTVPAKRHLWTLIKPFTLHDRYPDHTSAVHHAEDSLCTLAYAVSQSGARKILHDIGLQPVTAPFDILLNWFCQGLEGKSLRNCIAHSPGLFQSFRLPGPASDQSDISVHEGNFEKGHAEMIRWSTRVNANVILNGSTQYIDQYPDDDDDHGDNDDN